MYGCESWTIKKAEHQRIDAFEPRCWRRPLRVPWTARRSNQSILKAINPEYTLEGLMLKLKLQYFGHLMGRIDSFEKTLMLGKIEVRRRGQQWMVGCHHWLDGYEFEQVLRVGWWTGKADVLQSLLLLSRFSHVRLCATPQTGSPPGSPIPGILQARTLEWVAISFSNAWKWKVKRKSLSRVQLLVTPWTAAYQASPSMGFSRQEYWSGLPLPSPWGRRIGQDWATELDTIKNPKIDYVTM